ncbi:MAG: aminotransferase class V-fold PLP-dependent enzyme, partial [Pseudomonadales bacterium]
MSTLIQSIRNNVIGDELNISTPFGEKPLVYADYTASGRSLQCIESFIQQKVLPWYANTHTESSFTGRQTTRLREEARATIRDAVNGTEDDLVIFCGSGATAAVNKLIDILNMRLPADLDTEYQLSAQIPANDRPVVFIGPYEHHSNELPWRESIADLISIPLDSDGNLDINELETQLKKYQQRKLKIGSFSAASNVTGLKTDTVAISRLLHRYGALAFWDYAAAAPYTAIDMTGEENAEGDSRKDAVFISPHKFIGGPGTPGILVVKKNMLRNSVPSVPGGGTVSFVTPEDHRYITDGERREEGGTPAIVESIRAGLVFKLQQQVGTAQIEAREKVFIQRAIGVWQKNPNIEILGRADKERLSIVSLQIICEGHYLHYG